MISDEIYEEALKDRNNLNTMHSAAAKFIRSIDEDELHSCKLVALWKALKSWNPDTGSSFSTYLYKQVGWECLNYIKIAKKSKDIAVDNFDLVASRETKFYDLIHDLPDELYQMVEKRYVYNMTLQEIGDCHGCCYETVRKRLKYASKYLKNLLEI